MRVFDEEKIWYAPVLDYPDLAEDPQIRHNGIFFDSVDHAGRPIRLMAHPVRYDGALLPVRQPPPALGEHSREILQSLGYSEEKIRSLLAAGAIRGGGDAAS